MTTNHLTSSPPRPDQGPGMIDLLRRALDAGLPTGVLESLLDRIEGRA